MITDWGTVQTSEFKRQSSKF